MAEAEEPGAALASATAAVAPAIGPALLVREERRQRAIDPWHAGALIVAAMTVLPVLAIAWLALSPDAGIWAHLADTVLPRYLRTTLLLLLCVGLATAVLGVAAAWLVTMYRFPGRAVLAWALALPMAVPAYILAYVYTDILDFSGPVQTALRGLFGWASRRDYWFPDIRSLGGAVLVMTLGLYPYVYLLARASFAAQSACVLEVGRTLGLGSGATFRRIALPLARPAIVVGMTLAMMEALGDFGTVEYFAVATLTAGVYDAWANMGSTAAAAQLSLVMLAIALVLIGAERLARRSRRFDATSSRLKPSPVETLRGWRGALGSLVCTAPVVLGFVVPVLVLLAGTLASRRPIGEGMAAALGNSLMLATAAALCAVPLGFFLAYAIRLRPSRLVIVASRLAGLGYALPGAVLAVGVFVPLAAVDTLVAGGLHREFGLSIGLLLSGSIAALTYGYTARFLALSLGSAEAGLARIRPSMDGAARTLGCSPGAVLRRVHLPMLRGSLIAAGLLVFVETLKELPLTILLRPFNFETLATRLYQFAADDRFADGADGGLLIVLAGVVPVILLGRALDFGRFGREAK